MLQKKSNKLFLKVPTEYLTLDHGSSVGTQTKHGPSFTTPSPVCKLFLNEWQRHTNEQTAHHNLRWQVLGKEGCAGNYRICCLIRKGFQRRWTTNLEGWLGTNWLREGGRGFFLASRKTLRTPVQAFPLSLPALFNIIQYCSWWLGHPPLLEHHTRPFKRQPFRQLSIIRQLFLMLSWELPAQNLDWLIHNECVWFKIWFSTDPGASCSQTSLGEPSAVVTSGMKTVVTVPRRAQGKRSVDRISSVRRPVSSIPAG